MNLQDVRQLFEIFFNLQIQKRIVVGTIICGNTSENVAETLGATCTYIFFYSYPHLKTTVWTECAKDCIGSDHCTPAAEF